MGQSGPCASRVAQGDLFGPYNGYLPANYLDFGFVRSPRCVCLKPESYLRPYPKNRSIPTCPSQMRPIAMDIG